MNKKGFILLNTLIYAIFLLIISTKIQYYFFLKRQLSSQLIMLEETSSLEKRVLERVKDELKNFQEKDYTDYYLDTKITVVYDDVKAIVIFEGKYNYNLEIIYDDLDDVIANYRYN